MIFYVLTWFLKLCDYIWISGIITRRVFTASISFSKNSFNKTEILFWSISALTDFNHLLERNSRRKQTEKTWGYPWIKWGSRTMGRFKLWEKANLWKNCGWSLVPREPGEGRSRARVTSALLCSQPAALHLQYVQSACKSIEHHPSRHALEEACAVREVWLIHRARGKGAEDSTHTGRWCLPACVLTHGSCLPVREPVGKGEEQGCPEERCCWVVSSWSSMWEGDHHVHLSVVSELLSFRALFLPR